MSDTVYVPTSGGPAIITTDAWNAGNYSAGIATGTSTGSGLLNSSSSSNIGFLAANPFVIAPPGYTVYVNAAGFFEMVKDAPVPEAPPAPVAVGPRKPPPALPVEVHHTQAFDAERAHAATLAACRGQR